MGIRNLTDEDFSKEKQS